MNEDGRRVMNKSNYRLLFLFFYISFTLAFTVLRFISGFHLNRIILFLGIIFVVFFLFEPLKKIYYHCTKIFENKSNLYLLILFFVFTFLYYVVATVISS